MKKNYLLDKFVGTLVRSISCVLIVTAIIFSSIQLCATDVHAKILDEILNYEITADVRDDATVDLTYDVTWKVLDSNSEGPLEWAQIGLPNSHYNEITPLSDNITRISTKNSGGTYAEIYLDKKYYKDEIVQFSYRVNMDYMYQVYPEENVAEYTFTPGWFDAAAVDRLLIKWNSDKTLKIEPASLNDGGYYAWEASLAPGEKFTVEISYPTDAYEFDLTTHDTSSSDDDGYDFSAHPWWMNVLFIILCIICMIFMVALCFLPMLGPIIVVYVIYKAATGFNVTKEKKVTRTIIEYYDSCPNCGGSREEGKEKCAYCGTNMVKSKQEIKEEDIPKTDKKILSYTTDGEYRYSDHPNRYVRVHVVPVPRVHYTAPTRSSGSSSGRSHHSSCAHSSCACACACACAGGGRAGCSTKDFYGTNFKLKYFKNRG